MQDANALERTLKRIDGRGYKAYKDIRGGYRLEGGAVPGLELHVDHVQGDPFAAPSKVRLRVPAAAAGFPEALRRTRVRRLALADLLARRARDAARDRAGRRGSGKSGVIRIDAGGQEVLERSACRVSGGPAEAGATDDGGDDGTDRGTDTSAAGAPDGSPNAGTAVGSVELRLELGLPARGRSVLGRQAAELLLEDLPAIAAEALVWDATPREDAEAFVACVENQEAIRAQLAERGLLAFVADGSLLPRASGASDRPLERARAVPFEAPASLRVAFELPNAVRWRGEKSGRLTGMGVPRGVTLIVGGGYHGKSTLLRALERGVYPHVPGDGREYVVADPALVKIRAEDGRSVRGADIRPFIGTLPDGRDTGAFATDNASGSTSQAANIVEALEAGASGLLLDEDTCATNFMIRDARMQALVAKGDEPITPFIDRVRELWEASGVSSVLVMGGSGDYFDVADRVIAMRRYRPADVSETARRVARQMPSARTPEPDPVAGPTTPRVPEPASLDPRASHPKGKVRRFARDRARYGGEELELGAVEQLVDGSQTNAVLEALQFAARELAGGGVSVAELLDALDARFEAGGVEAVSSFRGQHPGNLARPRRFEVAAALNRLRSLRLLG